MKGDIAMLDKKTIERVKGMRTIGYWSENGGLEVKSIEYGVNDYILAVSGTFCGKPEVHRLKIHYGFRSQYVVLNGHRYNFNNCIKN